MASRTVAGLTLPIPVSGHPALELCNTRAGWGDPEPKEYLASLAHAWMLAVDLDLLPPGKGALRSDDRGRGLAAVLALRADLYAVLTGQESEAHVRRLGAAMLRARRHLEFAGVDASGVPVWTETGERQLLPALAFARAAEDLLTSPAGTAVGVCPGAGCGWLFTDLTHRRRWCSMKWCGNRAKVRAHAERARTAS